jgi:hypothetical protein
MDELATALKDWWPTPTGGDHATARSAVTELAGRARRLATASRPDQQQLAIGHQPSQADGP